VAPWESNRKFCSLPCTPQHAPRIEKVCEFCGAQFNVIPANKDQRYCSAKCFGKNLVATGKGFTKGYIPWNKVEHLVIKCKVCDKEFDVIPSYLGTKYCSRECYNKCHPSGYKVPFYHRRLRTPEERKRTSEANLKRFQDPNEIRKISDAHKGKKLTREQIRKCLYRRPMSSLEIKFDGIIKELGLPYKFVGNGAFFIERKNPDFININGEKIAVEVYSRKHKILFKGGIENWQQERNKIFAEYGWSIIYFDETQINKETVLSKVGGR
jgi:very-short-patch-repair endonuclease